MNDSKKILVGIDGSEGSLQALRWALAEARRRHDTVEVLHCWHVPYYGDVTGMMPYPGTMLHEGAEAVLAEALAAVRDEAEGVAVTTRVEQGSAAQVLIDASANADLIVVGRRGHGGFLGLLIGSVAQQVAGHSSCPVVIVNVV